MVRADVKDTDFGWKQIEKEIKIFQESNILIGFQEGTQTKMERKGGRTKKGGLNMAEIAAQNEFGTSKIPARPFMTTSFDENIEKISNLIQRQYKEVQEGKKSARKALTFIGVVVQDLIKGKIRSILNPPNSPVTIKIKGSSKPLIDFGQMIQSVRYKIEKNNK